MYLTYAHQIATDNVQIVVFDIIGMTYHTPYGGTASQRAGNQPRSGGRAGVSEVTVAARLRRLEEAGRLRVTAVTDIRLFGHSELVFAMLDVAGRSSYQEPRPQVLPATPQCRRCHAVVGGGGDPTLMAALDADHAQ